MNTYFTIIQYADHRKISRAQVYRLIKAGMPHVKQGPAMVRIVPEIADRWLDAGGYIAGKQKRRNSKRKPKDGAESTTSGPA